MTYGTADTVRVPHIRIERHGKQSTMVIDWKDLSPQERDVVRRSVDDQRRRFHKSRVVDGQLRVPVRSRTRLNQSDVKELRDFIKHLIDKSLSALHRGSHTPIPRQRPHRNWTRSAPFASV